MPHQNSLTPKASLVTESFPSLSQSRNRNGFTLLLKLHWFPAKIQSNITDCQCEFSNLHVRRSHLLSRLKPSQVKIGRITEQQLRPHALSCLIWCCYGCGAKSVLFPVCFLMRIPITILAWPYSLFITKIRDISYDSTAVIQERFSIRPRER